MNKLQEKNYLYLLIFSLLMTLSLGCSNKKAEYDTPEKVAKIFWTAILNKDAATATALVHESSRAQLGKMIAKDINSGNVPPLPAELGFEVQLDGDSAIVVVSNSNGVGCDLIKSEGRWWIR